VLELRYGLAGDGAATTAETARRLRLRPQHVRRLEELALRRLRAGLGGARGGGELLRVA
jgi:DNA-directed RNA polymerase sigma subunit (sigma70/sigma32)